MSLVRDILVTARAKVAHGWCQGQRWKTVDGRTCFCALGAIEQALSQQGGPWELKYPVVQALRDQIVGGVVDWNDETGRTQAEVLSVFDRAIEATS